jgi:trehalose 6-phosphate phosphatase
VSDAGDLPVPGTEAGRSALAALLDAPGGALVAFDFDGTLAPMVPDPAAARLHPDALATLGRLGRRVRRLAIVTGRPAGVAVELGRFAGAEGLTSLVVLGHYGLERWDAASGEVTAPERHPGVDVVRRELPGVLVSLRQYGARVEDKGSSIAVHTRGSSDAAGSLDRLREPLRELAERAGLVVEPGRLVLELRPPGYDKGRALRRLVAETSPSVVVFTGDDLGDLAAFDAVDALRAQGLPGLLVCSGSQEVQALAARADLVVDGPDGVVALMSAIEERMRR